MQIPTNKENIFGYQDLVKEDTSFPESPSDFDGLCSYFDSVGEPEKVSEISENEFNPLWQRFVSANLYHFEKTETSSLNQTRLHAASKSGCIEDVVKYLDLGWDIDAKDIMGATPIFYAIGHPSQVILKEFIERKASLEVRTFDGLSVLDFAFLANDVEAVKLLLDKPSFDFDLDKKRDPLQLLYVHDEEVRINFHPSVLDFITSIRQDPVNKIAILNLLHKNGFLAKFFHKCFHFDESYDNLVCAMLFANGLSICVKNDLDYVFQFFFKNELLNPKDVLFEAAELSKLIYSQACYWNSPKVLRLIEGFPIDLNDRVSQGRTFLHVAVLGGNTQRVSELIGNSADILARDHQGKLGFAMLFSDEMLRSENRIEILRLFFNNDERALLLSRNLEESDLVPLLSMKDETSARSIAQFLTGIEDLKRFNMFFLTCACRFLDMQILKILAERRFAIAKDSSHLPFLMSFIVKDKAFMQHLFSFGIFMPSFEK